jgi:hypothetical protein
MTNISGDMKQHSCAVSMLKVIYAGKLLAIGGDIVDFGNAQHCCR